MGNFASGAGAKYHDLLSIQKEYSNIQQRLIKHMKKCLGLSEDVIIEKLMPPSDVYLTAEEAYELGLCDKVSTLR